MATPFIGEIKMIAFNFPPKNYAFCDGGILPIAQNQALFSLLGTTYGGTGVTTFALPNLQGRMPAGVGAGFPLGQIGGEEAHTLQVNEMPAHTHPVLAVTRVGTQASPAGNFLAAHRGGYSEAPQTLLAPGTLANAGGSQPHFNMPPYLTIPFVIAVYGVYPTRS
jgi:microcystin-dependent protein